MIRRRTTTPQQALWLPDLMPLLDVIFIVLVFFLLTAQTPLRQLPIAMSQTSAALPAATPVERRIELTLLANGEWQLDGAGAQPWPVLERQLGEQDMSQMALTVMTDRSAPLASFMAFLVWLKQQPLNDVELVLESTHD